MRIAITAGEPTLDADVDPRFGRCAYFVIVNTDTMDFEAIENPNTALGQGAGIRSAQLVAGKGVNLVLTGHCGPKAYEALLAAGIGVVLECSGIVRDAVAQFQAGKLKPAVEPNVISHAGMADKRSPPQARSTPFRPSATPGGGTGMNQGPCGGSGKGMGRGMAKGMGRGRGQGRGRGGRGQGQGGETGSATG